MLNINRVLITGRLSRDPETKYLPSGTAITNLNIANNRRYQVNGEWKEEVGFFEVELFGKAAERVQDQGLTKGQPVYVEGRLKQESWEKDGKKQSKTRISADIVKKFEVPEKGATGDSGGSSPRASDRLNFDGGNDDSDLVF